MTPLSRRYWLLALAGSFAVVMAGSVAVPLPLGAQLSFPGFSVTDIDVYALGGGFFPRSQFVNSKGILGGVSQRGLLGVGFELTLALGADSVLQVCTLTANAPETDTAGGHASLAQCDKSKMPHPKSRKDSLALERKVSESAGGECEWSDEWYVCLRAEPGGQYPPIVRHVSAEWIDTADNELALGYTQIGNMRAVSQDYRLRGAIREWPLVTYYRTWCPDKCGVSWYVGVSTGLLQLAHMNLYSIPRDSAVTVFSINSDAIAAGLAGGIAFRNGFFVELQYRLRFFDGLDYKAAGSGPILKTYPTSLDLSGFNLAAGYQIHVQDRKSASGN